MAFVAFGPGQGREPVQSLNTADEDILSTRVDPVPVGAVELRDGLRLLPQGGVLLVADGYTTELASRTLRHLSVLLGVASIQGLVDPGAADIAIYGSGASSSVLLVSASERAGANRSEFANAVAECLFEQAKPRSVIVLATVGASATADVAIRSLASGAFAAATAASASLDLPETLPAPHVLPGLAAACLCEADMRSLPGLALVGVAPSREPHCTLRPLLHALRSVAASAGAGADWVEPVVASIVAESDEDEAIKAAVAAVSAKVGTSWSRVFYS